MHPADIKAALEKRGYTLTRVGIECGVTTGAVGHTIHGRPFPSPRVRARIAEILDIEETEIWPEEEAELVA